MYEEHATEAMCVVSSFVRHVHKVYVLIEYLAIPRIILIKIMNLKRGVEINHYIRK